MVRLNRIYTRTGDDGTTGLGDGSRRAKHDARVEAFGAVDEANCAIGLARLETRGSADAAARGDRSDAGAGAERSVRPRRRSLHAAGAGGQAERGCASRRARSNGSSATSTRSTPILRRCARSSCRAGRAPRRRLHQARVVCRRAERRMTALAAIEPVGAAGARLRQPAVRLFVRRRAGRQRSRPRRRAVDRPARARAKRK